MTNEQLCVTARTGDLAARDMLLARSQDFIRQIAKSISSQYQDNRVSEDDLMQEGCLGLLAASPRYRLDKGTTFHTYAGYWVRKLIRYNTLDFLRKSCAKRGRFPLGFPL